MAACQVQPDAASPASQPLRLGGPPAIVSFPLMRMADTGIRVRGQVRPAQFRLWHGADQLRVLLARGELDASAAPTHVPALLAQRGQRVRLLNVSVWGMLWLISADAHVRDFADLRGRRLLTPYRRDMGAITLQAVLEANGLAAGRDVQLQHTRDADDSVALMLAGRGENALLPEPTASLLLWRSEQSGGPRLHRVRSLETEWAQRFPAQAQLPQAGVMAAGAAATDPELAAAIVASHAQAARWCKTQVLACARLAQRHLPAMPLPALASAIRETRLDGVPARQVRPQLEAFYRLLLRQQPDTMGGRLPADGFYGP